MSRVALGRWAPAIAVMGTLGLTLAWSTGCEPGLPADAPPIAGVWMGRCNACHIRVEPGTRSREHLADAFQRHQKRVHLTSDEWTEMVDYLAKKDTTASK